MRPIRPGSTGHGIHPPTITKFNGSFFFKGHEVNYRDDESVGTDETKEKFEGTL